MKTDENNKTARNSCFIKMPKTKHQSADKRRKSNKTVMQNLRKEDNVVNFCMEQYWQSHNRLQGGHASQVVSPTSMDKSDQHTYRKQQSQAAQRKPRCTNESYCDAEQNWETETRKRKHMSETYKQTETSSETQKKKSPKPGDISYRQLENKKQAAGKLQKRLDQSYKKRENLHVRLTKKRKRENDTYRQVENSNQATGKLRKRLDQSYKVREELRETQTKKQKRENDAYRRVENRNQATGKLRKRLDQSYKVREKLRETQTKKQKRENDSYRRVENRNQATGKLQKRLDQSYKVREKLRETQTKKQKRENDTHRQVENRKQVTGKLRKRRDQSYKVREKLRETPAKKRKRENDTNRQVENRNEARRKQHRRLQQPYKDRENLRETQAKKRKRENDLNFRTRENLIQKQCRQKYRQSKQPSTMTELIDWFHDKIAQGPVYVCCCCEQLWYKHSVVLVSNTDFPDCEPVSNCLISKEEPGWICTTCVRHLKTKKYPPCAIANNMSFPEIPNYLKDLKQLEWRLVSPRIPFMKIHQAPRGGQWKVRGNVVNVPADVSTTYTSLPHVPDDNSTIRVKLKRHLKYKHHVLSENVRPEKVRQAAQYLVGRKLFKDMGIKYDMTWIYEQDDTVSMSDKHNSDSQTRTSGEPQASTSENDGLHASRTRSDELQASTSCSHPIYELHASPTCTDEPQPSTSYSDPIYELHVSPTCTDEPQPSTSYSDPIYELHVSPTCTDQPQASTSYSDPIYELHASPTCTDEPQASISYSDPIYELHASPTCTDEPQASTSYSDPIYKFHVSPTCTDEPQPSTSYSDPIYELHASPTCSDEPQPSTSFCDPSNDPSGHESQVSADICKSQQDSSELDNDDLWSESETDEEDSSPGVMDTLLTAPNFIEDYERDIIYNFAPGQGSSPLSIFRDKYSEELSYPNIFCGESRAENAERKVPVYYSEICKSELRRADRRVAKDVDNLFFKTKKIQMKQMLDKVQVAVRKCKSHGLQLNAGILKDPANLHDIVHQDIGYKFLNTVRGSPPYFQAISKDLFAVIRHLGPATLFTTFSAAETRWHHLLKILGKLVEDKDYSHSDVEQLTWHQKSHLIQSDPVTCARQFDYQVNQLFKFLKSDQQPIGEVEDHFHRVEFQQRGSPHIHCLLWIKGAPRIGFDSDQDVTKYIDNLLTCRIPPEGEDEGLAALIKFQLHHHTHTCRKGKKFQCRFNYPLPPLPSTQILHPLTSDEQIETHKKAWCNIQQHLKSMKMGEDITFEEFLQRMDLTYVNYIKAIRSSIQNTTIFLRRTPSEIRVNAYNPHLLKAWRANIDIQYVTNTYACATYLASYVTKSQRGMSQLLRNAAQEARHSGSDVREQLRVIGSRFLNTVEISAQEACYILLQLPMKKASRQVIFVNTSLPEDRVFLLKPQHVLQSMDDANEEVEASSLLKRYSERPKHLELLSLAEFASFYTKTKQHVQPRQRRCVKEDGFLPEQQDDDNTEDQEPEVLDPDCHKLSTDTPSNVQYSRRKVPRILRTCRFNKATHPEKHYRMLVMLYTHWRDETVDLIGDFNSYEDKYNHMKDSIEETHTTYEPFAAEVDEAEANLQQNEDPQDAWDNVAPGAEHLNAIDAAAEELQRKEEPPQEQYDFGQDMGLPARPRQEDLLANHEMPDDLYRENMRTLNKQQAKFLLDILYHAKTSEEPIHRFLSGGAGVGKTHVSNLLYQSLLKFLNKQPGTDPDKPRILLAAPTGKAAFLIKGNTLHSALRIPVSQKLTYRQLDWDSLNTLRTRMSQVKYIFIDEVSMLGSSMATFIHKRLQDISGSPKDFGGYSIIFIGDLFQLKPVCDSYIFLNSNESYSPLATNLWQKNVFMFELSEIMRQTNGGVFAKLLNRMREGHMTQDDIHLLQSRTINRASSSYASVYNNPHLFLQNNKVDAHNSQCYMNAKTHKVEITAIDTIAESMSAQLRNSILERVPNDPRKTMQLHSNIQIAESLKYELAVNINTSDGLTNGAGCIVKRIATPPDNRARGIIWVEFNSVEIGQETCKAHRNLFKSGIDPKWTPILPHSRKFLVGKSQEVTRTQFPLRPASAKTVHRSQGDTESQLVVDFTGRSQMHIHYVALSRVKTVDELHIINFDPEKVTVSDQVKTEMSRLRQKSCPSLLTDLCNIDASLKIAFINAQSLHKHRLDVEHDYNLQSADLLLCAETRFQSSDTDTHTNIQGFTCFRNDEQQKGNTRPYHGLAAYSKPGFVDAAHQKANRHGVEILVSNLSYPRSSSHRIQVICVYKPPNVTVSNLTRALCSVFREYGASQHNTIVIGDFNIDYLSNTNDKRVLQKFTDEHGLSQLITYPTTDMRTTIDHVYANSTKMIVTSGVAETYYSFHKAVWIALT